MLKKNIKSALVVLGLLFSLSVFAASGNAILDSLFHDSNDPVIGNKNGKITIVEFFDYQCSHCVNMAYTLENIVKNNPDVRVVYKEFPIRGAMSDVAARAALAANMQGKYYPLHHALLTTDQSLSESTILSIAKAKGLNVDKLKKDMSSATVNKIIAANKSLANRLGIAGTPAFFIGKTDATDTKAVKFELGEMSQSTLQEEITKLRQ